MNHPSRVLVAVLLLLPRYAFAQHPRDNERNNSYPFGYEYSPWQVTPWDALQYRTKCEGEQIRGMQTGPIKWMIEFRNRTTDLVSFDYTIAPPGEKKHSAAEGRGKAKPGKIWTRLAVVPTTRCDDGVVIKLDNLRIGPDIEANPYRKPDHAT